MNLFQISGRTIGKCADKELHTLHKNLHLVATNINLKKEEIRDVASRLLMWHAIIKKEMANRNMLEKEKEVSLIKQIVETVDWVAPKMEDVQDFGYEKALKMSDDELKRIHEGIHFLFWDSTIEEKETLISLHDIASKEMVNRGIEHNEYSILNVPENITKKEELVFVSKPYPNEHAARINEPNKYVKVRRKNDYFKSGIHVIWGITEEEKTEVQSIRFDKDTFTVAEAKKWLKDNDFKFIKFEPSKEKVEKSKKTECSIFKKDKKKQIVYGIVMEPDTVDTDGEFYTAEEVEKAYYKFQDKNDKHYDIQHQEKFTIDKDVKVVEEYLAPADFEIKETGQKIKKGSWIMGLKIFNEKLWKAIEDGILTGYSIQGYGYAKE